MTKIIGLLPDRLLDVAKEVSIFDLYQAGGKVVGALPIIFVLYTALSAALCPLLYQVYRKKEAG